MVRNFFFTMWLFAALFAFISPGYSYDIVYISPHEDGHSNPFWRKFEDAMKHASDDLNDKIEILYTNTDPFVFLGAVQSVADRESKPDAIITPGLGNRGLEALKITEDAKIPTFLVNIGLTQDQAKEAGKPGEKYKYWIAEILPDEEQAGYQLAESLYRKASELGLRGENGKVNLIGISANDYSPPSIGRVNGLKKFAAEQPDLNILHIIPAKWEPKIAEEKLGWAIERRYNDFQALWTLSANMSAGAVKAAQSHGKVMNKHIVAGDIDWSEQDLNDIMNEDLTLSVGGHYFDGAWALILAHDYLSGHDFRGELGSQIYTKMYTLDRQMLQERGDALNATAQMDFSKYSKAYNRALERYNFDPFMGDSKPSKIPETVGQ